MRPRRGAVHCLGRKGGAGALQPARTWTDLFFARLCTCFFPSQNPGAGFLLGSVTVYMDSYRRARLGSAALRRRYNVRAKKCVPKRAAKNSNLRLFFFLLPAEHKLHAAVLNEPSNNEVFFLGLSPPVFF